MGPKLVNGRRRAAVLAFAAASLMLVQCKPRDAATTKPVEATPVVPGPTPAPVMTPQPALGRAELITAISEAASAYAAGQTPTTSDPLVGKQFAVRLRFGCTGPQSRASDADGDGLGHWSWGSENKTIALSLTPGDWTGSALIAGAGANETWEAVEGFWIVRPWLSADACPGVRRDPLQSGPALSSASPQTMGLAAVFAKNSSRIGRRNGRAYSYTVRPDGDAPLTAPQNGYVAVLEGRIAAFPGGRAVRCRASGPDQRPVCIAAVQLDRVSFVDPASDTTLGEWRGG